MAREGEQIGPYVLQRKLGKGAFKEVWLATKTSRYGTSTFALGLLMGEIDETALLKEAHIWRSVGSHPNVNQLIDIDEYDDQVVIISDYVEGGTLAKWLEDNKGVFVDEGRILSIIHGVLCGLRHLHHHQPSIVHRDLKPSNVLLRGEVPVLTDFGLARAAEESITEHVAGTPAYMAPEMFDRGYSVRSDLWAVGVILHRMLSWQLPFGEQGQPFLALARAIQFDEPRPLPSTVSPATARVVVRALQKDPDKRFSSAAQMLAAVEAAMKRTVPTGMVTVLFTDIANSTGLKSSMAGQTQEERDQQYRQTIKKPHDQIVVEMVHDFEGFVAKDTGDGFLTTFANAERAVLCAIELQQLFASQPLPTPEGALRVRMGLTTGHIAYQHNDYIGAAVDKASRVLGAAAPTQVLLSSETYELVRATVRNIDFAALPASALKGIGTETLYAATLQASAKPFRRPAAEPAQQNPPTVKITAVPRPAALHTPEPALEAGAPVSEEPTRMEWPSRPLIEAVTDLPNRSVPVSPIDPELKSAGPPAVGSRWQLSAEVRPSGSMSHSNAHRRFQTRINPIDGAAMERIGGGAQILGDSEQSNNLPHTVTLAPFWVYRDLVTVAMFRQFCDSASGPQSIKYDWDQHRPEWGWCDDHPMVCVTWYEAQAYCRWAGVRLLSESEWEFAARGADNGQYPWGNRWNGGLCANSVAPMERNSTAKVGSFPPNAYNLNDMAGNVWQWCRDAYGPHFWQSDREYADPCIEVDLAERVVRGGSWCNLTPGWFRSARRYRNRAIDRFISLGFRCGSAS